MTTELSWSILQSVRNFWTLPYWLMVALIHDHNMDSHIAIVVVHIPFHPRPPSPHNPSQRRRRGGGLSLQQKWSRMEREGSRTWGGRGSLPQLAMRGLEAITIALCRLSIYNICGGTIPTHPSWKVHLTWALEMEVLQCADPNSPPPPLKKFLLEKSISAQEVSSLR